MSKRLSSRWVVLGETKEAFLETIEKLVEDIEKQAVDRGHRAVWDTATMSVESVEIETWRRLNLVQDRYVEMSVMVVEEPQLH